MNRSSAKHAALAVLDRWEGIRKRVTGKGARFVVLKNRQPQPGHQDAGYMFTSRFEAMQFAEARYGSDFALFALTEKGSVDLTPA